MSFHPVSAVHFHRIRLRPVHHRMVSLEHCHYFLMHYCYLHCRLVFPAHSNPLLCCRHYHPASPVHFHLVPLPCRHRRLMSLYFHPHYQPSPSQSWKPALLLCHLYRQKYLPLSYSLSRYCSLLYWFHMRLHLSSSTHKPSIHILIYISYISYNPPCFAKQNAAMLA